MDLAPDIAERKRLQSVFLALCTTACTLLPTGYAAYAANSAALVADFLRCIAEFFAIVISWLVLRKIRASDRSEYNFGFGKLEQLAGLAVATALFVTFLIALLTTISKILNPEPLTGVLFGFWLAVLSIFGNGYLWLSNYYLFQTDPSPVLDAQWRLFRAKTFAVVVVSISVGSALLPSLNPYSAYIDTGGSLCLAAFLLWSAYSILTASIADLVDKSVEEQIQMIVLKSLIDHDSEYRGLKRIRTRRAGARLFIELTLYFAEEKIFGEISKSISKIEQSLREQLPECDLVVVATARSNVDDR